MTRDGRGALVAHLVVVAVGLLALGWAVLAGEPTVTCRGEVMQPGAVCRHSPLGGGPADKEQTYEERRQAAYGARPVIGAVGALVAVFGLVLVRGAWRRQDVSGTGP